MANSKGPSTIRNTMYNGKNSLLPPKSPFPSISPSYTEFTPASALGPKPLPKPRDVNSHHQRTSSESVLIEEQPSWLDELLDEPETPVRKNGHRRSSSDSSFAYIDNNNNNNMNFVPQDDKRFKNIITPVPSWGSQDFDYYSDVRQNTFYVDPNASGRIKNKTWDAPIGPVAPPRGLPNPRGNNVFPSPPIEKLDHFESDVIEKRDPSQTKSSSSETDTKRAKQQFAQRSRVRKLQYIAELERNVQALQAEGSEISAEVEFLNQKNFIMSMENKALKQRLESLAQEKLIKYLEHEVLEREVGRLKMLYQQQQPPPPPQTSSSHRRSKSRDLDQQFMNLSIKHKEPSSAGSGQLHI